MPAIPLMRTALQVLYRDAQNAHAGLLLQRGYCEHEAGDAENVAKTKHIQRVCRIPASEFYRRAYDRWVRATANATRFAGTVLRVETRLFIGLSGGGALETGCAIHHSYGVPYIPGSGVKGAVNAFVRGTGFDQKVCDELFGAAGDVDTDHPDGLSGLVVFHDAWWVPDSAKTPLVQEVVTTHHLDYYGQDGAVDATDLDSPVPNAQVAVRGSFLFTLEGPSERLKLAVEMLERALAECGVGAKTRAGYGICVRDEERLQAWKERRAELQKAQEAEQERRGQEAERARRAAEIAALPEERRLIQTVEERFNQYMKEPEVVQRQQRDALNGELNRLAEAAQDWKNTEDRRAAADLLSRIYDAIGWADPGQKKEKREKQEKKRRARIDALRSNGDRECPRS